MADDATNEEPPERVAARKRLVARREFFSHVASYFAVNVFLIVVWAVTGAGYFWPIWVIAGWAIALAFHAWEVFGRRPITEADIDAELRRKKR
jgi:hypothetical protein